jgi:PPK2 family polyphosphate:nucleotide phosphotransferase
MRFTRYLIKPGSKVRLTDWDPGDRSASPGSKEEDTKQLEKLSERLAELQNVLYAEHKHALLIVLQGMDTSGKDGTIRKVFSRVDPLGVRAVSFKAPTEEERDHDFLWRVHRHVPGKGEIVIFNRSHYEDVLVVRVHGLITDKERKRRYVHINNFEWLLADSGTTIVKFYLHISKEEQKKRLQERLEDPRKRWKFRVEDLAERERWHDYRKAYEDAMSATSTDWAPWYVVPADSEMNRNLFVSQVLLETLESLKMRYPKPKDRLEGIVIR